MRRVRPEGPMERAKQERSHVSPFCIHTVSARATLRVGRKAPLSGLSQNVLLNNVGVPSPWEVGEGTAWRLACAAAHVALGRGLPPSWEATGESGAEGSARRPRFPRTSCEGRCSRCHPAEPCPASRAPWPVAHTPQRSGSGPFLAQSRQPMGSVGFTNSGCRGRVFLGSYWLQRDEHNQA